MIEKERRGQEERRSGINRRRLNSINLEVST